jgi:hypothetical protein
VKPALCPVCGGTGEYQRVGTSSAGTGKEKCHGCDGRGWVQVQEDYYYGYTNVWPPPFGWYDERGIYKMRVDVWFLVDSMAWEMTPEADPVLGALRMAEEVVSRLKAEAFNRQLKGGVRA